MSYEWKTDKAGNRRYVRSPNKPLIQRLVESTPPGAAEITVEPPDEPVAEKVDTEATPRKRKTSGG